MNNLLGVQWCWNAGLAPASLGQVDTSGTGAHRLAAGALETPVSGTPFYEPVMSDVVR